MSRSGHHNGDGEVDPSSRADSDQSLSELIKVVSDDHRRMVLEYLISDPNHTATVAKLCTYIRARVPGRPVDHLEHDTIEISLHHVHLPKLVEAGLVNYDAQLKEVHYRPHDQIEALVEAVEDDRS